MDTYIIIDDESLIRKGTIKKIENSRNDVICVGEAINGSDGIALSKRLHPDFVILDMQMPVMDGALKRLKNNQNISQQIISSQEQKEAVYYEYDIQYLTNLIHGFHTGESSITSQKLNFINDTHQLVLLTLYSHQNASKLSIQEWLEEGGFGDLAIYLTNNTYPQIGFLILFLPNQHAVKAENLLKQITDALLVQAQQKDYSLLIGISHIHSDLKELHAAFQETSEALNQQLLNGPALCCYSYDEENITAIIYPINAKTF